MRPRPSVVLAIAAVWALKGIVVALEDVLPWHWLARKLCALHQWIELRALTWLAETIVYCQMRAGRR